MKVKEVQEIEKARLVVESVTRSVESRTEVSQLSSSMEFVDNTGRNSKTLSIVTADISAAWTCRITTDLFISFLVTCNSYSKSALNSQFTQCQSTFSSKSTNTK
jgi:hypothetical protein